MGLLQREQTREGLMSALSLSGDFLGVKIESSYFILKAKGIHLTM